MIKRPPQQTKVHIVHKTIKKSQMTTDYVNRHGLKPTMRAFSVNDTMINGATEHGHILAIHLSKLRTLINLKVKFIEKNH